MGVLCAWIGTVWNARSGAPEYSQALIHRSSQHDFGGIFATMLS
jgi:hypothetical protein